MTDAELTAFYMTTWIVYCTMQLMKKYVVGYS